MKIRGQEVFEPRERITRMISINPDTNCWEWKGARRSAEKPYGRLVVGSRTDGTRRTVSAHRYAYETFVGPIGDLCVCHHCDNPPCCNPSHLFLGTKKDNSDDRDKKGRNKSAPTISGSDHPQAKLTWEQVSMIRVSTLSSRRLASIYGISDSQIRALRRGEHYLLPPITES